MLSILVAMPLGEFEREGGVTREFVGNARITPHVSGFFHLKRTQDSVV